MRAAAIPEGRVLGYVRVQVASRVYELPVRAATLARPDGSTLQPGFVADDRDQYGIVVDRDASDADVQATIAKASADAERHISRKVLN
jgi:hypothetical protein